MDQAYHPEEDQSAILKPRQSSVYRGLIGSSNWIVTLGRFDIAYAVQIIQQPSQNAQHASVPATTTITPGTQYDPNYTELKLIKKETYQNDYQSNPAPWSRCGYW
jgi:hypothetical protein